MKLEKGNYDGASTFAFFDKPVEAMTEEQAKALLAHILHQAMPGEPYQNAVLYALALAEERAREQGVAI